MSTNKPDVPRTSTVNDKVEKGANLPPPSRPAPPMPIVKPSKPGK